MYKRETKPKAKKTLTHICSECLGEFHSKDIFTALAPTRDHSTLYCEKCLGKLKIEEYKPYNNPKAIKTAKPAKKPATTKKPTAAKKPTTKKPTAAKKPVKT